MKTYSRSGLTGGTSTDLDGIDGGNLIDGDRAIVVTSGWSYIYSLDADSGDSESSPQIIKPDINADNKRWILSKHVEYIPTMDQRQVFIQSSQPVDGDSEVGDLWIDIS